MGFLVSMDCDHDSQVEKTVAVWKNAIRMKAKSKTKNYKHFAEENGLITVLFTGTGKTNFIGDASQNTIMEATDLYANKTMSVSEETTQELNIIEDLQQRSIDIIPPEIRPVRPLPEDGMLAFFLFQLTQ